MKKLFALATFSSIILFASMARAEESAFDFMKSRQAAIATSGSNSGAEIDKTFDYNSLVENSMGSNWNLLSDDQKAQVKSSLTSIIRSSLKKRLSKVKTKNIVWSGAESNGSNVTIIRSVVELKKPANEQFEIDWVISNDSGSNKVIDIIFDGVSTVETYRRQFNKLVKSKGIDALVNKLKEKADQNLIEDGDGC